LVRNREERGATADLHPHTKAQNNNSNKIKDLSGNAGELHVNL
jgi:hypothetical protein